MREKYKVKRGETKGVIRENISRTEKMQTKRVMQKKRSINLMIEL